MGICYWTPKTFCSQKRSLIDFSLPDKIISPSSTRSHCLQRGAEPGWPSPLLWCSLLSPTPFSLASQKTQGESPCASDIPPPCFSPSASFLLLPPSLCVLFRESLNTGQKVGAEDSFDSGGGRVHRRAGSPKQWLLAVQWPAEVWLSCICA